MIEVRITRIGKVLPWWKGDYILLGEIRNISSWQIAALCQIAKELRHATMLEF